MFFIVFALLTLFCATIAQLGGDEYSSIFKTVALVTFLGGMAYFLAIFKIIKRLEMYVKLFLPGKTDMINELRVNEDSQAFMDRLKYPCVVYLENVYIHQVRRIINSSELNKSESTFFKNLLLTLDTICTLGHGDTDKALDLFYQFDMNSLKGTPKCPKAQACIKLGLDIQIYIGSAKIVTTSS